MGEVDSQDTPFLVVSQVLPLILAGITGKSIFRLGTAKLATVELTTAPDVALIGATLCHNKTVKNIKQPQDKIRKKLDFTVSQEQSH